MCNEAPRASTDEVRPLMSYRCPRTKVKRFGVLPVRGER